MKRWRKIKAGIHRGSKRERLKKKSQWIFSPEKKIAEAVIFNE